MRAHKFRGLIKGDRDREIASALDWGDRVGDCRGMACARAAGGWPGARGVEGQRGRGARERLLV